jgi:S1-C subfamily serine protease
MVWAGGAPLAQGAGGVRVGVVPFDSPLYKAGLAQDDQITRLDGVAITSPQQFADLLGRRSPGGSVPITFVRRSGGPAVTASLPLEEDPRVEIVAAESTGATLTAEQQAARAAWLASKARR